MQSNDCVVGLLASVCGETNGGEEQVVNTTGSLTTDPVTALEGARKLEIAQQQWARALQHMRPTASIEAFGSGYGHFGAKIVGMATKAHEVREAHAHRLMEGARAGRALINAIHGADTNSADDLAPVMKGR